MVPMPDRQTAPMRCAERSLLDEPLAGTAAEAGGFVLVEHPGPWGERALEESGRGDLERRCKALGLRALLVRPAAQRRAAAGRAYVAWCGPDPFLCAVQPDGLEDLLETLAAGVAPAGDRLEGRLWLVCTNGKRDRCCAKDGVPVAQALAERLPDGALECTHLGGHRFAANVLLLPEGLAFGRVTVNDVDELLEGVATGRPPARLLRGRSSLVPAAQAAEIVLGPRLAHPRVELTGDVVHVGGRSVLVTEEPLDPRPVSCGVEPEPLTTWRAELLPA